MDKLKHIIYLSYDGMTDPLGQSQVLPYLAGLSKKGYQFHLVSFEKKNIFEKKSELIEQICKQNNINWLPQKYTKKPPLVSTIWDLYRLYKIVKKLIKTNKIEFIHCRSYLTTIIANKIKKKYRIKYLFDMRGFWVDERVEGNIWNIKNPLFRFIYHYLKNKEKTLFNEANYCISLTEVGKQELLSWDLSRENTLPIQVIPCCVDLDLFDYDYINENDKNDWLERFKLTKEDYVFSYLGSLSTVYRFDIVLDVILKLKQKNNAVKLIIITHEDKSIVDKYLKNAGINNDEFIKYISLERNEVPYALAISDYSISFYIPTFSRKGTSPTRLAEILSCGIKTITNSKVGDTKDLITNHELGFIIEDFSENEINRLVNLFPFEKAYDKKRIRNVAKQYYDLNEGIEKYARVYNQILSSHE